MHDVSAHLAHHTPPQGFIRKYIFSVDHKVIGKQYYGLGLFAVVVGMALSWLMRIHLVWPNFAIPGLGTLSPAGAPGGIITPEYYLQLMTMHGTLMVFFVLTNVPFAGFGNFFLLLRSGRCILCRRWPPAFRLDRLCPNQRTSGCRPRTSIWANSLGNF